MEIFNFVKKKNNFSLADTPIGEIEDCFKRFVKRDDIDIILINQSYAELIRHVIDAHTSPLPAVLEIPSKDHPYDASKDSILRRAKVSKCDQQLLNVYKVFKIVIHRGSAFIPN